MQIKYLHGSIYKVCRIGSKVQFADQFKEYREQLLEAINKYEISVKEGLSNKSRKMLGIISKATYYRYLKKIKDLDRHIWPPKRGPSHGRKPMWTHELVELVLSLRKCNPTYGKKKIQVILARDYKIITSESTVGRILKNLMDRRLIFRYSASVKPKRSRRFNRYAKPYSFKRFKDIKIGERVQIDHMVITKNNRTLRHFNLWDRKSKSIMAAIYTNATSHSAKLALDQFIKEAPFKITSIQVDGGSEFMAEFEDECKKLGIELFVLPPKRPQLNGGVERGNRTFREDFYNRHDDLFDNSIEKIREELSKAVYIYNNYRPHQGLNGDTPMGYLKKVQRLVSDTMN
jgi:transposase InsO family protein